MPFMNDLENAAIEAACQLRYSVDDSWEDKRDWGMKLEAQMVAETYHILRSMSNNRGHKYTPRNLVMEYHYKSDMEDEDRSLWKPDLIFFTQPGTQRRKEQPVEFKVLWKSPIKKNGDLSQHAVNQWNTGLDQALNYSKVDAVIKVALVVAYLGPENTEGFALDEYSDLVMARLRKNGRGRMPLGHLGQKIVFIPC